MCSTQCHMCKEVGLIIMCDVWHDDKMMSTLTHYVHSDFYKQRFFFFLLTNINVAGSTHMLSLLLLTFDCGDCSYGSNADHHSCGIKFWGTRLFWPAKWAFTISYIHGSRHQHCRWWGHVLYTRFKTWFRLTLNLISSIKIAHTRKSELCVVYCCAGNNGHTSWKVNSTNTQHVPICRRASYHC